MKWRAERSEDFLSAHMGRDQHFQAVARAGRGGQGPGAEGGVLGNFGAVPVGSTAMIPLMIGPKVLTSVYHVPAVDYFIRGVLTNTMATGAYRGAGRPGGQLPHGAPARTRRRAK